MKSIRGRLMRELLAVALLLLSAGWLAFFLSARDELIEQFDAALRARALTFTALAEIKKGQLTLEAADRLAPGFGKARPRDFFEIWGTDGVPALRSDSLGSADLIAPATGRDRHGFWNLKLPDARPGRALLLRFPPRSEARAASSAAAADVQLVVASDREGLDRALDQLGEIAAIGGLLLLIAIFWGVPRILRRGLRPLDAMAEQVARIQADSLAERLPTAPLPAELVPIAEGLNALLARLEGSFERERRFSADLAHELRTPIAELRTLAECALKWPESREPSTDRDVLATARHMESLVTQLLLLARGEQNQLQAHPLDLSLDAHVQEAWAPFAARAAERGLRMHLEVPAATVRADPVLLRSILYNLFDNAVDYTPAEGQMWVTLEGSGEGVWLRVANAVDALEARDIPQLFDRFWRKEAARSGQQHLGLGLTLARTFAEAMGWSLGAAYEPQPPRLVFTLTNSR